MSETLNDIEVEFIFKGAQTVIQSKANYSLKNICQNFKNKQHIQNEDLTFVYSGNILNDALTFTQCANTMDRSRKKMTILVNKNDDNNQNNTNPVIIQSKEIICPKCFENSKIRINNYKIKLSDCKNNHISNNIYVKDFEDTQKIDLSKIICEKCKQNKGQIFQYQFYICTACKANLCPTCKVSHEHKNNIIDYEQKNYLCQIHYDNFNSFCKNCKSNICTLCENNHLNHEKIGFGPILPNIDNLKNKMNELKKLIDNFKLVIQEINKAFNNVEVNLEKYYNIYNNIIEKADLRKRNYELIYNLNMINKDSEIFEDLKYIVDKNNKLSSKFNKILDINEKINKKSNILDLLIDYLENSDNKEFHLKSIITNKKNYTVLFETKEFNSNNCIDIIIDNIKNNKILKNFILIELENKLKLADNVNIFSDNKQINNLKIFFINIINNNTFHVMINNANLNKIIENEYLKNLLKLNINFINSNKQNIAIYNGFFIPKSITFFSNLKSNISNIRFDEYIQDDLNIDYINLDKIEQNLKVEINKNELMKNIFCGKEELYKKLLLDDYFKYFIINLKNYKDKNKDYKPKISMVNFLKFITKIKLGADCNYSFNYSIEEFSKIVLFTQSYKSDINFILEQFIEIDKYCENFEEIMIKILNQNKRLYQKYFMNINFKLIIEIFLKAALYYSLDLISNDKAKFEQYFQVFISIEKEIERLFIKYNLISNEIFNSKTIIKIKESIRQFEKIYEKIVNNLFEESIYFYESNFDLLFDKYQNLIKVLDKNTSFKNDGYYELLANIYIMRYENIENEKFKINLIEQLLENKSLFKYCGHILFYYLKENDTYKKLDKNISIFNCEFKNRFDKFYKIYRSQCMNKVYEVFNSSAENKSKYVLINLLINNDQNKDLINNLKDLQHLKNINRLSNLLLKIYSHKIISTDAKNIIFKNELESIYDKYNMINNNSYEKNIDQFTKEYVDNFFDSWNSIKNKCLQYKCHCLGEPLDLKKNSPFIYFLVSDKYLQGRYLASAYQNMINWQNELINLVVENNKKGRILYKYISQLENSINIQDAKDNEIININENIFNLFDDLIFANLIKNIFILDDKNINLNINNLNYNFDFDFIEEQLGKVILSGVKKFKNNINFMIYLYQNFQGENSFLLRELYLRYPNKDLDNEEQKFLLENMNYKNLSLNELRDIYSSLCLIIHEANKNNYETDCSIYNIIKKFPKYILLNKNLVKLFNDAHEKNIKFFQVDKLFSIYELLEELCWKDMQKFLPIDYKFPLEEEKVKIIIKYFDENKENEGIIDLKTFISALRKFISRYLLYNDQLFCDITNGNKLYLYISACDDLWPANVDGDKLKEILYDCLKDDDIIIGQCYNLWLQLIDNAYGCGEKNEIKAEEKKEDQKNYIDDNLES